MGVTKTKEFKSGTMLAFIRENLDENKTPKEEATRLLPMLQSAGYETTVLSVLQAVGVARRRLGLTTQRPARAKASQKPQLKQNPRVEALESFVDDALKGLTLLKGELRRLKEIEKKYLTIKAQLS